MESRHPTEKLLSEPKTVNITGFLSPFKQNDQPHFIRMPGNPHLWLAVFSTIDKLALESCSTHTG